MILVKKGVKDGNGITGNAIHMLLPEALNYVQMAGLLAYPADAGLLIRCADNGQTLALTSYGLTVAGTAPDFHRYSLLSPHTTDTTLCKYRHSVKIYTNVIFSLV